MVKWAVLDLKITNGRVASSGGCLALDVGISSGKIAVLGDLSGLSSQKTVDATGKWVLPGAIDTQVHFREPGLTHKEDIESGTRAAIWGGVTTIFEMPNTVPATTTEEALGEKLSIAARTAWCDFAFFVGASIDNLQELARLEMLPGTPGIKLFAGSSTGSLLVEEDESLRAVFNSGSHRMPVHSELESRLRERKPLAQRVQDHPVWRDEIAAIESTKRLIKLSESSGRPLHVLHVSTLQELDLLWDAKQRGLGLTCEVTPQHLWFAAPQCYDELGTFAQMNPPIRTAEHREALWQAVNAGLFDVFGSDHAPHTREEKAATYPASPSGIPGVQTLFPILLHWVLQGKLTIERVVAMMCENPALIYGIQDKGFIREGYDADLVIFDPNRTWKVGDLQSKCGWSPWEGVSLSGTIEEVYLRGQEGRSESRGKPVTFNWK